ncbi:MAG: SpoIIIAH-like family protein [Firmicutes bacterium]|nr:SpoIIIAH-like family protein [Bacillota bacterium]
MKKLPRLREKWRSPQSLAVLALIALMLAASYFGGNGIRVASVNLPMERVDSDIAAELAQATPMPNARLAETQVSQIDPVPQERSTLAKAASSFDEYRLALTHTRAAAASLLNEVILNAAASADTVQEALRQKAELARSMEVETAIETLLAARGFADALCTVRKGSVSIIVRGPQLTQQQAAQILDIAMSESFEPAANIRIIPAQ